MVKPPSIGLTGVTTSLCFSAVRSSSFANAAGTPSTVTEEIVIVGYSKSRENERSGAPVVAAVMVAVASIVLRASVAPGVQARSRS